MKSYSSLYSICCIFRKSLVYNGLHSEKGYANGAAYAYLENLHNSSRNKGLQICSTQIAGRCISAYCIFGRSSCIFGLGARDL
jgi:hypothetical protein